MSDTDASLLPMLERRRIEAQILKQVYDKLSASHGKAVAEETITNAVRASLIEQAKGMAADVGGQTSMQTFVDRQSQWTADEALEIKVHKHTNYTYKFDVVRCRYSGMYREMGVGEIGHL